VDVKRIIHAVEESRNVAESVAVLLKHDGRRPEIVQYKINVGSASGVFCVIVCDALERE
jgi:hypothetical protein